jgi:hypothetical protein
MRLAPLRLVSAVSISSVRNVLETVLDSLHQHHQERGNVPSLPEIDSLSLVQHSARHVEGQHHQHLHATLVEPSTLQHAPAL